MIKANPKLRCKICRNSFTPTKVTQVYCNNPSCKTKGKNKRRNKSRQKNARLKKLTCLGHTGFECNKQLVATNKSGRCKNCKRIENRWIGFLNSKEGRRFVSAIYRGGNIEVFPELDDIKAFVELIGIQSKGTGIYDGKAAQRFDICHKYPLFRPDGTVGLYSRENLTLAPSSLNKSNGNKIINSQACYGTHFIYRDDLSPRYEVLRNKTSASEIRNLLFDKFGYYLVEWVDSMAFKRKVSSKIDPKFEREGKSNYEMACALSLWIQDGYYCQNLLNPVTIIDDDSDWDDALLEVMDENVLDIVDELVEEGETPYESCKGYLSKPENYYPTQDWFKTYLLNGDEDKHIEPIEENVESYFTCQLSGAVPSQLCTDNKLLNRYGYHY